MNAPLYHPPTALDLRHARSELVRLDPVLDRLNRATPEFEWRLRPGGFSGLVKMVIEQQISVAAAASVWSRFVAGLGEITPERVLNFDEDGLKVFGLSLPKARYALAIAQAQNTGTIDFDAIHHLTDAQAITALTAIKGVGRWTAEMFLMFYLMRPNVLPLDDVGLINGISRNYFSGEPVSRSDAREVAQAWKPYCTVATWYIWRSLDPVPVAY